MAPNGLLISKLAIQVTANDDVARSILCLKICLPQPNVKQAVRWGLFSNSPPHLLSAPQIHPLPLTYASRPSDHLSTAARLLSLPNPIQESGDCATKPIIEVHPTSRQVYVSLNQGAVRRRDTTFAVSPGGGVGRREYLVVMECEQAVDRVSGWSKLNFPLPKCLDNSLRFQILPPSSSSSTSTGEVSIVTDPKILPLATLPSMSIRSPPNVRTVEEDGWEDGESLGPEDLESESDEGGSWLEGRFQSTDQLRLEWSLATIPYTLPKLNVVPKWDIRQPSIQLEYITTLPSSNILPIEAVIPDGWGWSELDIQSDHLLSWYSTDGDWWDTLLSSRSTPSDPDESHSTGIEDSNSTIRARRNGTTSHPTISSVASLMRHPLPQPEPSMDEYSFELGHTATPSTPEVRSVMGDMARNGPAGIVLARPAPAQYLEMEFEGEVEEAEIRLSGRLIPLSKSLLVSPAIPVDIPMFRLPNGDGKCQLGMPGRSAIVDMTDPGTLRWEDDTQPIVRSPISGAIRGDIQVKLRRSEAGHQMTIAFTWPKRPSELAFTLPRPAAGKVEVKVIKAAMRAKSLPRAVVNTDNGATVHIARGDSEIEGNCEVVIQLGAEVILPVFEGAEGKMKVELVGPGWDGRIRTNLTRLSTKSYSLPLPCASTPYINLSSQTPPKSTFTFSWSTLLNLFLLYLLVSLAQQVQRLRVEVTFIAEEAKDLRKYNINVEEMERRGRHEWGRAAYGSTFHGGEGLGYTSASSSGHPEGGEEREAASSEQYERGQFRWSGEEATSLGRLVMGQSGWDRWMSHPTLVSLSRRLGWLWHTVVWLVHA